VKPIVQAGLAAAIAAGVTWSPGAASDETNLGQVTAASQEVTSTYGDYLAGRFAEQKSDYRTAATLLARVLEARPDDQFLRQRTLALSLSAGLYDQAVVLSRQLVEAGETQRPTASEMLALDAIVRGDYAAALATLADTRRTAMARFSVPLTTAWAHAGLGEVDQAIEALAELDDQSGFDRLRALHAGLILESAGRNEDALAEYGAVSEDLTKGPLRAVRAIALIYERTGRTDEARQIYTDFLAANPDVTAIEDDLRRLNEGGEIPVLVEGPAQGLSDGLYHLATAVRGNVDTIALAYARMSLFLDEDNVLSRLLVGQVLEERGRYHEAIEEFALIGSETPYHWQARLSMADSLEELEQLDEAVDLLEGLAAERPERSEPLVRIGIFMHARKRYDEAVDAFDRALGRIVEPRQEDWLLFYRRGMALERAKNWPRAEKDFLKALELEPDQPYVLNYLGYSWIEQGMHFEEAEDMLRKAVSLREDDGYIVDSLGWVLFRLGEYDEAVGHLEMAVQLLPTDPIINDHLGDAYWRVGRKHEARFQWERALRLEPEEEGMAAKIEDKLRDGLEKTDETPVSN